MSACSAAKVQPFAGRVAACLARIATGIELHYTAGQALLHCCLSMQVLRLVCSCLQNAPASDTWDLSSLLAALVNGSPVSQSVVSQSVVTAVLSVVYSNLGDVTRFIDEIAILHDVID